jgi:hypothetical protein
MPALRDEANPTEVRGFPPPPGAAEIGMVRAILKGLGRYAGGRRRTPGAGAAHQGWTMAFDFRMTRWAARRGASPTLTAADRSGRLADGLVPLSDLTRSPDMAYEDSLHCFFATWALGADLFGPREAWCKSRRAPPPALNGAPEHAVL